MRSAVVSTGVVLALCGGAGLALAAPSTAGSPAGAATGSMIGLSRDGSTWAGHLDEALFSDKVRWVPGDERTAQLWVRNQAPGEADLTVGVALDVGLAAIDDQALRVLVRAGDGRWHDLSANERPDLGSGAILPRGSVLPVEVKVTMRTDAPNSSMVLSSGLRFVVRLSDSRVVAAADGTSPSETVGGTGIPEDASGPQGEVGSGAVLPETGSPVPPWAAWAACGLTGLGLALLVLGRRRRSAEATAGSLDLPYHSSTPHVLEVPRG